VKISFEAAGVKKPGNFLQMHSRGGKNNLGVEKKEINKVFLQYFKMEYTCGRFFLLSLSIKLDT
jgi:hypothetical protein